MSVLLKAKGFVRRPVLEFQIIVAFDRIQAPDGSITRINIVARLVCHDCLRSNSIEIHLPYEYINAAQTAQVGLPYPPIAINFAGNHLARNPASAGQVWVDSLATMSRAAGAVVTSGVETSAARIKQKWFRKNGTHTPLDRS